MGPRAAFKKHSYGKKAFKLAAEGNFRDALDLIDKGGDIHYEADYRYGTRGFYIPRESKCNIGFIALEKNNMQALEDILLKHKLDPDSLLDKDSDWPLLRSAIIFKNQQAVDLLVKAGARVDLMLESIQTMREFAKGNGIQLPPAQASANLQPSPKF